MKRFICGFLILLNLLSLCACTGQKAQFKAPVDFYYCLDTSLPTYALSDGVVDSEKRESAGYQEDLTGLLNLYLQGPLSESLRSPYPEGVTVAAMTQDDSVLDITLTAQLAKLNGYDLTLACTCLAQTLFGLTEADAVQICVDDGQEDSRQIMTIGRDQLLFEDISTAEAKQ